MRVPAEDVVHKVWGDFGWYQVFINFLSSLMNFAIAWQMLSMPFLAPKAGKFWCGQPEDTK